MSIRRSPESPPSSAAGIIVRNDIDLAAIPAADWDSLVDGHPLLSHVFLSALHATGCAAPAARPRAGGPATSRHGATTRCSARCPSTPRRIRMANTCLTGRGPTPFAGMAAATIRSSSRRSRSRLHLERGSSRGTRPRVRHCSSASWKCCTQGTATKPVPTRRCTSSFRRRTKPTSARAPA